MLDDIRAAIAEEGSLEVTLFWLLCLVAGAAAGWVGVAYLRL